MTAWARDQIQLFIELQRMKAAEKDVDEREEALMEQAKRITQERKEESQS